MHITLDGARAYLPTLHIEGRSDPVVQIVNEATNAIEYTIRIRCGLFVPKVFEPGTYVIRVFEPGTKDEKVFTDVEANERPGVHHLTVQC